MWDDSGTPTAKTTPLFPSSKAKETQRLLAGAPSQSRAGDSKRPVLNCQRTHSSCDGTADCLIQDCGSVGHRHLATTGTTSPKKRRGLPVVAGRYWDHGTYVVCDPRAAPALLRDTKPKREAWLPVVTGTTGRTSSGTPERHRLFSERERRTSRDLGAAPPEQKRTWPPRKSLEIPRGVLAHPSGWTFPPLAARGGLQILGTSGPGSWMASRRVEHRGATGFGEVVVAALDVFWPWVLQLPFQSWACWSGHVQVFFGWPQRLSSSADSVPILPQRGLKFSCPVLSKRDMLEFVAFLFSTFSRLTAHTDMCARQAHLRLPSPAGFLPFRSNDANGTVAPLLHRSSTSHRARRSSSALSLLRQVARIEAPERQFR